MWGGDAIGTIGFVSLRAFKWVPIWGVYCVWGWWYGYHRICLTERFQISHNMRGLLCDTEGVMLWVPLDLSHWELSNEYQYEGFIVWGGDAMGNIGFVSLRAFKWVPIWGVYCVRGWCYGYHWICLIESFQMSPNVRGLLCEEVMIWVALDLSHWELWNEYQYEGSIGWDG